MAQPLPFPTTVRRPRPVPASAPARPVRDLSASLTGSDAGDLAVELAHDLRSPLSAVLVLAEQLQSGRSGPVTERQRRELGLIYSAAFRLCQTASDVVDLARRDGGLGELRPGPFSLAEVLEELRATVLPMAVERGLELRIEAPAVDRRIGHARSLSRALLNLTTNALKYTDVGEVTITALATGTDLVEFTVADTGRGIDPAALKTLYEPFHATGSGERAHFNSAGLGLAIVRRLVSAMGGELDVITRPKVGTRFFFELRLPPAE